MKPNLKDKEVVVKIRVFFFTIIIQRKVISNNMSDSNKKIYFSKYGNDIRLFGVPILNCFRRVNFDYDSYCFIDKDKTLEDLANFKFDDLENEDFFVKVYKTNNKKKFVYYPTLFWCERIKNTLIQFLDFFVYDEIHNILPRMFPNWQDYSEDEKEQKIRESLMNALDSFDKLVTCLDNVAKKTAFLFYKNDITKIGGLWYDIESFRWTLEQDHVLYENGAKQNYSNLIAKFENDNQNPLAIFGKKIKDRLGLFDNPNKANRPYASFSNYQNGVCKLFNKYTSIALPLASYLMFIEQSLNLLDKQILQALNDNNLQAYLKYALNYYNFYKEHSEEDGHCYEIKDLLDFKNNDYVLRCLESTWFWSHQPSSSYKKNEKWQDYATMNGKKIMWYDKVTLDVNINNQSFLKILEEIDKNTNAEPEIIKGGRDLVLNEKVHYEFVKSIIEKQPLAKIERKNFDVSTYKNIIDLSNEDTKNKLLELHKNYLKFIKFQILDDVERHIDIICDNLTVENPKARYSKSWLDEYETKLINACNTILNKEDLQNNRFKR